MKIDSSALISENMQYHIDRDILLSENMFRYGSEKWAELIREARQLYQHGFVIELDEAEYYMLESDIGELGIYEGCQVILDTPEPIWEQLGRCIVYVNSADGITKIEFDDPISKE
jgi:hypothetical protein